MNFRKREATHEDFYLDMEAYKTDLLDQIEQTWKLFYPIIDDVVKKLKDKKSH